MAKMPYKICIFSSFKEEIFRRKRMEKIYGRSIKAAAEFVIIRYTLLEKRDNTKAICLIKALKISAFPAAP